MNLSMLRHESDEVLYATTGVLHFDSALLKELGGLALKNPRKRIRLCTHLNTSDVLHEMFIVHTRETYVRPHRHSGKAESFHVVQGEVDVVLFSDQGKVETVIPMGSSASGKDFYYRLSEPKFHTLLVRSELLVFHEVTTGPFDRQATEFAPWAPTEDPPEKLAAWLLELEAQTGGVR